MKINISIIIPLYNKSRFIGRALASVQAGTIADFEAIVVDDGSSDGGGDHVGRLGDSRFRLIVQENGGPGSARNRGLREASGKYVAFLDADDEWLPEFLETGIDIIERQGADIAAVCLGYIEYPSARSMDPLWRRRGLAAGPFRINSSTSPELAIYLTAYMTPLGTLLRTETVRRWGGFFDRRKCLYGEDAYLWLKILLNETVYVSLQPLACYHREASELSRGVVGPRPVEPFLTEPEQIVESCPAELRIARPYSGNQGDQDGLHARLLGTMAGGSLLAATVPQRSLIL